MKTILLIILCLFSLSCLSQQEFTPAYYKRTFEARYMQKPPVFAYGRDSLHRYFFSHFPAMDTILAKAVEKGDTAKYIRIYFSFYLDELGFPYEPQFERVASTRSPVTGNAKTIRYFFDMKPVLGKAIRKMINKMPQWKPGLEDGVPVKTLNHDYLQFWVGLSAPQ